MRAFSEVNQILLLSSQQALEHEFPFQLAQLITLILCSRIFVISTVSSGFR
jgi:hypothetical protein